MPYSYHDCCLLTHFLLFANEADWTSETEQKCLGAGFDGVLRKPIILSVLKDFLNIVVDKGFDFASDSISPESGPAKQNILIPAQSSLHERRSPNKTGGKGSKSNEHSTS